MIKLKTVTLNPVGADGSATATVQVPCRRPGILRYIGVDYTSQASTADLTIKDVESTNTLFTAGNTATDIGLTANGVAIVQAGLSTANGSPGTEADGSQGIPFTKTLEVKIVQANGSTITNGVGNKSIVVKLWIEQ